MNRIARAAIALTLAAGAAPLAPGADIPAVPAAPPPGAVALWNGRDLDGWTITLKDPSVDPASVWSVRDGCLRLTGRPFGYVRTVRAYGNFHLHAEWMYPVGSPSNANSGVFVLVHGNDKIWPAGIECQLRTGEAGQLIATEIELPGAPVIRGKQRANPLHASSEKPFGQWNAYDIFCRGRSIEVWVNGVMQNRFDGLSFTTGPGGPPPAVLRGSVCLQLEGAPIAFRNVWLEPVPFP